MMGAMMPQSGRSRLGHDQALFAQLVQLVDASGRVTYIPNVGSGYGDAEARQMGQLLLFGRPVLFTEKLPALGTAGDVLLCDFSKYIVADTGTLEIAASDQYAFNTNQITFRIIQRVDGQPRSTPRSPSRTARPRSRRSSRCTPEREPGPGPRRRRPRDSPPTPSIPEDRPLPCTPNS
jgi:hypothetical protein